MRWAIKAMQVAADPPDTDIKPSTPSAARGPSEMSTWLGALLGSCVRGVWTRGALR